MSARSLYHELRLCNVCVERKGRYVLVAFRKFPYPRFLYQMGKIHLMEIAIDVSVVLHCCCTSRSAHTIRCDTLQIVLSYRRKIAVCVRMCVCVWQYRHRKIMAIKMLTIECAVIIIRSYRKFEQIKRESETTRCWRQSQEFVVLFVLTRTY